MVESESVGTDFRLRAIAEAAKLLASDRPLPDILQAITDAARRVVPAHQSVTSTTVNDDWAQAINAVSLSDKYARWRDYTVPPDGTGIYSLVARTNRPMRVTQAELEAHPAWRGFGSERAVHPPMRGWLAVPLTGRSGRNIGLLQLSDRLDGEFTQQDEDALTELAAIASVAIENARLVARLRASEAEFRHLADSTPQVVWIARRDGTTEYFNRRWYEYTGMPQVEGDAGWTPVLHPDDLTRCLDRWHASVRTGEPYEVEYRLRRAGDGQYRWFIGRALPHQGDDGRVVRWFGTCTDIHDQKAAEERARQEAAIVDTINSVGRTVAAELDLHKVVQTVVDATTKLTKAQFGAFFYNVIGDTGESYLLYALAGAPKSAFEQYPHPRATDLFGPTFQGEGVMRLDDVTQDPRYGRNAPHHGMPKGHLPVRSYLAVPVVSRTNEVLGGLFFGHPDVGVFTCESERVVVGIAAQAAVAIDNARLYDAARRANESKDKLLASERAARSDAEQANRVKDEFLSVVSHELRTPLNAILGWAQILRTGDDTDDLGQGLEVIERNARSQVQIIEDLLDMGRIISGKVRLDVQRVDLPAVIEAALASMQPAADAKGVRLQKVLDPLAGPVSGDPSRLQQVVWNLLSNAIKFTPKGGRVRVTLERVNSHVEVSVSDTGEGIKPEFLPYVFERFRQADATTTRRYGGLGLGLSIVKNLVELHGGQVNAKSAGEGRGSTFRIALPLSPVHGEEEGRRHPAGVPTHADAALLPSPTISGVRVLVVDDDPDSRALVKKLLEGCGGAATVAGSVEEALRLLGGGTFDVLVSDIGMPERDGYDLIRTIRQLPDERGRLPAVALTAYARSDDRTKAMIAGFDMHIAKPVDPAELCAVVARLARRR